MHGPGAIATGALAAKDAELGVESGAVNGQTTQKTTPEKILGLIKVCPSITRQELADKLGLSPDGIKYHLQKMKLNGLIHYVGSTKAGHCAILKT
jgi:ATP-dependent DNA helicase RecG